MNTIYVRAPTAKTINNPLNHHRNRSKLAFSPSENSAVTLLNNKDNKNDNKLQRLKSTLLCDGRINSSMKAKEKLKRKELIIRSSLNPSTNISNDKTEASSKVLNLKKSQSSKVFKTGKNAPSLEGNLNLVIPKTHYRTKVMRPEKNKTSQVYNTITYEEKK